jgi:hypothetical protein
MIKSVSRGRPELHPSDWSVYRDYHPYCSVGRRLRLQHEYQLYMSALRGPLYQFQ